MIIWLVVLLLVDQAFEDGVPGGQRDAPDGDALAAHLPAHVLRAKHLTTMNICTKHVFDAWFLLWRS